MIAFYFIHSLGDSIDLVLTKQFKYTLTFEKVTACSEFDNELHFYIKKFAQSS
jgi:hypothetical protein